MLINKNPDPHKASLLIKHKNIQDITVSTILNEGPEEITITKGSLLSLYRPLASDTKDHMLSSCLNLSIV